MDDRRLIFLISAPRSGSTLLQSILAGLPGVRTAPEPHILPPLAHLGYWDRVQRAPYDPLVSQRAIRRFVGLLPEGEEAIVAASRACADRLYRSALGDGRYFLDKTPANALVVPFIVRLYPRAARVVLTRHPAAVLCSYADSFFDGDFAEAVRFNPILERYIPALAAALPGALRVRYEDLVTAPEAALARVCRYLDLPCDAAALDYTPIDGGDRDTLRRRTRPTADRVHAWAADLAANPGALRVVEDQIARLDPADLDTLGYPLQRLWAPLNAAGARSRRRPSLSRAERWLLLRARRGARNPWIRRQLQRTLQGCEVLLR